MGRTRRSRRSGGVPRGLRHGRARGDGASAVSVALHCVLATSDVFTSGDNESDAADTGIDHQRQR